jgi:hypothetical protein
VGLANGTPTLPDGRGATVTFVEYEAEAGETNGTLVGPTRTMTEVAAEASARRAVRLDQTGEYVQFTNQSASNSIVVRYSIPDSADGTGIWATLGVYVDGELRTRLSVTSRYSWTYGQFGNSQPNDPNQGSPHHFYDESHALIGDVPIGATVMLRKDADDMASYYVIDLVDMEQVPPPLPKPDGFLSIVDCGATPNDDSDDWAAIQGCVDRARGERRGLYIPEGAFRSLAEPISVGDVTIRGAGMWYSSVYGFNAHFDCWDDNCRYYDFAVFGDTIVRDDGSPETAFGGNGSSGVVLENIWMEHTKTGYWTGPDTDGLSIRNCRIRNLYADGVNFFGGTKNSIVENTHARNTGDDAFASWSPADRAINENNVFRNNYVQVPWMANCFGIYGGQDILLQDNVCADVVQYPGILLARQFNSHPFAGTIEVRRNSLIRAGGRAYDQPHGAFKLHAAEGPLQGVHVEDLDIIDATYSGIHLQGGSFMDNVWFEGVNIVRPGSSGFYLNFDAEGTVDASYVIVQDAPDGGIIDHAGGALTILRGAGNVGF